MPRPASKAFLRALRASRKARPAPVRWTWTWTSETCRHTRHEPDPYEDRLRGVTVERWRCARCKVTVGVGHSDESPVAGEIRAALLARDSTEAWSGLAPGTLCTAEGWGWHDCGADAIGEPFSIVENSGHWHSGWLARAIVDHDPWADGIADIDAPGHAQSPAFAAVELEHAEHDQAAERYDELRLTATQALMAGQLNTRYGAPDVGTLDQLVPSDAIADSLAAGEMRGATPAQIDAEVDRRMAAFIVGRAAGCGCALCFATCDVELLVAEGWKPGSGGNWLCPEHVADTEEREAIAEAASGTGGEP